MNHAREGFRTCFAAAHRRSAVTVTPIRETMSAQGNVKQAAKLSVSVE